MNLITLVIFSAGTDSENPEDPKKQSKRRTHRKRTTNLGPRLKVLGINPIDNGLKVECQMETAKQKTITFEFSTITDDPEIISETFVKEDLLPHDHREILVKQLVRFCW